MKPKVLAVLFKIRQEEQKYDLCYQIGVEIDNKSY